MGPRTQVAASGVLSLGLANLLAVMGAAAATTVYAGWLEPRAFAHWAGAMALARAAMMLLDGGLKTALVRRSELPSKSALRRLAGLSTAFALMLAAVLGIGVGFAARADWLREGEVWLWLVCPLAYLLTYPALFTPLARLERVGAFDRVGRAEGTSYLVEFLLPLPLMAIGLPYWASFAAAAVAARALRLLWVVRVARGLDEHERAGAGLGGTEGRKAVPPGAAPLQGERTSALVKEGSGVQAVAAISMLRDHVHIWLVGPWFGAYWAGLYAFAFSAAALFTQVFAHTAARVSLPALRSASEAERWALALAQVRRLATLTIPPLALLPAWLSQADTLLWDGRWHGALALLPWIALRMVAGVAATPLGALLLVARTPWQAAGVHAAWTGIELALAVTLMFALGPTGLAVASAIGVWSGVAIFVMASTSSTPQPPRGDALHALEPGRGGTDGSAAVGRLREAFGVLLLRPSAAAGIALGLMAAVAPAWIGCLTAAVPLAWLAEPSVRRRAIGPWFPPRGAFVPPSRPSP